MRRAVLIYNPAAGSHAAGRLVSHIERQLSKAGLSVDSQATASAGEAEHLARSAAQEEVSAVFVCGGDGSLRECAAGLLGSPTPLGFIPCGTANVMARVLKLPGNAIAVAAALANGEVAFLDVGMCNDQPFLMQASAGLDAEILRRVRPSRKRFLGRGEVALAALSGWFSYRYPRFEVSWPGGRQTGTFAAICNIPFYGGDWRMAPGARWDDGRLDLVLFGGSGRAATLGFARDLVRGKQNRRSDVTCLQVEEATLSAAPGLGLQLDGDRVPAQLPATVKLASRRVRFLVPSRST